ncbi:MAG: DUF5103 domain-containing protein [Bacteroidota bacterium]|nr:MAG: DUF5103 domain-containing protein [Bacteroidota bacterium]
MRIFVFLILLLVFPGSSLKAQTLSHVSGIPEVHHSSIGNVVFHPIGSPLSFPAINLYDAQALLLQFDLLTTESEALRYEIDLCLADWSLSALDYSEFIAGFEENTMDVYSASFNTTLDYLQYRLQLPNEEVHFRLSGNYLITVFNSKDEVLLQRRFVVYESGAGLTVNLDKLLAEPYSGIQAIEVKVNPQSLSFNQLAGNMKLAVMQNANWYNLRYLENYHIDDQQGFLYTSRQELKFEGLNEFRYFDTKSLRTPSASMAGIEYKPPFYNVYLKTDGLRGQEGYFAKVDFDGNFYIWNQESHDDEMLDADYAWVHFTLETGYPFPAEVYVDGSFSLWQYDRNNMTYNSERGIYELNLLLKQGIYNYRYVTKEYNNQLVYSDLTEGNHYETGNSYQAFLYYRQPGERNDRLVGYGLLSTGMEIKEYDKNEDNNLIKQILEQKKKQEGFE